MQGTIINYYGGGIADGSRKGDTIYNIYNNQISVIQQVKLPPKLRLPPSLPLCCPSSTKALKFTMRSYHTFAASLFFRLFSSVNHQAISPEGDVRSMHACASFPCITDDNMATHQDLGFVSKKWLGMAIKGLLYCRATCTSTTILPLSTITTAGTQRSSIK